MRQDAAPIRSDKASFFWTVFGWTTHALFGVTVYYLFLFLKGVDAPPEVASASAVAVDALLALQFAVVHSVLLLPHVRKSLSRFVPSPAYGVLFCLITSLSLLATIWAWQPFGGAVWNLHSGSKIAMQVAFYAAWVALFYSLSLTGLGYQTGWTTWFPWSRGKPIPVREFKPRGAYLLFRHPVYLSFLGLIWLTPCMTYDRAVLTAVWTVYIFYGSHLKDRRLLHYIGDRYRAYQSEVPGYPGLLHGPLAKVPWNPDNNVKSIAA